MVKGELREDDVKTCWRCGYKITSGSICPMCGAVNKEDEERTLTPEDEGKKGHGGGKAGVGNGAKVVKADSTPTVLSDPAVRKGDPAVGKGDPAVGKGATKAKVGGSMAGRDMEKVRRVEDTGRKVRGENGGVR